MSEQIIFNIVLALGVGIGVPMYFFLINKKAVKKQDEMLKMIGMVVTKIQTVIGKIDDDAEAIRQTLDKITNEKREFEIIPKQANIVKPSNQDYDLKANKCLELLKDPKWTWRSDIILMRKSGLTQDEFNFFVNNTDQVIKSKKPDIYGNNLYSLSTKI